MDVQELIPSIKFLTNMVAHYTRIISSRFDNSRFTCRKAGVVVKHIYLRELRIELTAKGFDYCLPSEIALQ